MLLNLEGEPFMPSIRSLMSFRVVATFAVVAAFLVPSLGVAVAMSEMYGAKPASVPITKPGSPNIGSVVISQVYGGGGNSGAPWQNDFIEIFNRIDSAISVAGWSVQYASAGGSTWQVTSLTGSVAPGGYYLVQEAAGAGN